MNNAHKKAVILTFTAIVIVMAGLHGGMTMDNRVQQDSKKESREIEKIVRSEEEWRQVLTAEQCRILRNKGTERAFTGAYHDFKGKAS